MDHNGVKPTGFTYRLMIRMYCALGEMNRARGVFDSMANEGFALDLTAFKMLINGYVKSKRKEETMRLAEEMLQNSKFDPLIDSPKYSKSPCEQNQQHEKGN
ncbi:hypothetical protein V6N13_101198 [Hibiscus sabdariffa]|uniref:Pentatricopeptide repeat-containing protein n=1 Tax=Hibiscus sabdariffa TaxID=183260 RepID=A0ABR2QL48_9ROSI